MLDTYTSRSYITMLPIRQSTRGTLGHHAKNPSTGVGRYWRIIAANLVD